MALKTYEQYLESLRRMRPNMYKWDELITDVTTHPATKRTVEGHAWTFKAEHDEKLRPKVTTKSHLTGDPISRYLSIIMSPEDMYANSDMKRLMFHLTGTCTGGRCAGWCALNAMYTTTWEMDRDLKTDYHQRFLKWLRYAQDNDITISGALTDAKGDRAKSAGQQEDKDVFLHLVEKRKDGIVVRGAKLMICGVAAANEIFIIPGTGYKEDEADFALAFVIPKDIDGLTIVETRHPSDTRDEEDGFDNPVKEGGITQAFLFFEDVFIPNDRVFMCGETKYAMSTIGYFIAPYRSAIGGCVAGQGDIKIGSAILTARANGLSSKVFNDKLTQMHINNETTYALGIAAAARGKKHESGAWLCDPLLANVNKVHVATLPYQTSVLAQDIAGGIAETGCMPSYKDFQSKKYGHLIKKYLKAKASAESRARAARLVEWSTIGGGVPGCMHGGGSPDGAKLVIRATAKLEEKVEIARRLAGITEEIPDPGAVKK
ncbi:4-hydroxyphenylacetate 3-hydroxylase [candidate division GN15 bacterium]|uniref:4-hydroxyphenylacetate 3-hydroxylase n=1 Tax=candidate division GN15 bacterium TaxID=2072418 RepID=A0A855X5C8_9BACT|nr:MAG: 4-hydroxyphenylacetate 3-hydroxylase [candidate division GN15 bacterium]